MRKLKHRRQRREDQAREITKYEHCQGHALFLTVSLKAQLDRYAQLHSQTWEQKVDAAALVPHIVAQFLADDRVFRKLERMLVSKTGDSKLD